MLAILYGGDETTMMTIERVLIVGLGGIGLRHLRIARKLLPHAEIRILRREISSDLPIEANGSFNKISDAIDYAPTIVIVANPSSMHFDIATTFAQIGSHLLVEKPLTNSFESSSLLVDICRRNNVTLMTGYNLRFLDSLQIFRQSINQEVVGKPLAIRAEAGSYLPSWRPRLDYRASVSAQLSLGGGVLLELSHEIDYLRWIFGEVVSVWAKIDHKSNLQIDVEDTANLNLEFKKQDNTGTINANVNLDFYRHDATRLCTVICENGTLRWSVIGGTVEKFSQGSSSWEIVFQGHQGLDETYFAEWHNFLESIDKSSRPIVSGEDGVATLKIVDAARSSSSSGTVIYLADYQSRGVDQK